MSDKAQQIYATLTRLREHKEDVENMMSRGECRLLITHDGTNCLNMYLKPDVLAKIYMEYLTTLDKDIKVLEVSLKAEMPKEPQDRFTA